MKYIDGYITHRLNYDPVYSQQDGEVLHPLAFTTKDTRLSTLF